MNATRAGPTRVRLFVAAPLVANASLVLPAAAARHVQVLRLQPGASLLLFNGQDGAEWQATVLRMGRSEVEVQLGAGRAVDREQAVEVTIAIGVPANDRMDALVEKACELGVAAIQPLLCERSVLRLAGERGEARRRHWAGVAVAASEQCGRTRVAEILAVQTAADWLGSGGGNRSDAAARSRIVLSLDAGAAAPGVALASLFAQPLHAAPRPRLVALSGPEGGLSLDEEAAAVAHGFVRVGLGPRVLRADTAPLALLAWLALRAGDTAE